MNMNIRIFRRTLMKQMHSPLKDRIMPTLKAPIKLGFQPQENLKSIFNHGALMLTPLLSYAQAFYCRPPAAVSKRPLLLFFLLISSDHFAFFRRTLPVISHLPALLLALKTVML